MQNWTPFGWFLGILVAIAIVVAGRFIYKKIKEQMGW